MATLSLVNKVTLTYGEILQKYLDEMTEEERNASCSGAIIFGVGDKGGFYSVIKRMGFLECIGLVEELKYFLILDSLGEINDYDEE